jgi:hypothetical protein
MISIDDRASSRFLDISGPLNILSIYLSILLPLGSIVYLHKHRINAGKHPCFEWDSNP